MLKRSFRTSGSVVRSAPNIPINQREVPLTILIVSGYDIASIAGSSIQLLKQLIREPNVEFPFHEDDFRPLCPQIGLYLSNNRLRSLPDDVFNLENLQVLSLRNNQLSELSPSIEILTELCEFNLSNNRFRWLPFELMRLALSGQLWRLHTRPNPFFKAILSNDLKLSIPYSFPDRRSGPSFGAITPRASGAETIAEKIKQLQAESCAEADATKLLFDSWIVRILSIALDKLQNTRDLPGLCDFATRAATRYQVLDPIYLGMSSIAYFHADGTPVGGSPPAPSRCPPHQHYIASVRSAHLAIKSELVADSSCGFSLVELILRECTKKNNLGSLSFYLPKDAPPAISDAIQRAKKVTAMPIHLCSVCRRKYIQPRAEWIEYWRYDLRTLSCSAEDIATPFLRRACSWKCTNPADIVKSRPFEHNQWSG